jgi:hypothetical protein
MASRRPIVLTAIIRQQQSTIAMRILKVVICEALRNRFPDVFMLVEECVVGLSSDILRRVRTNLAVQLHVIGLVPVRGILDPELEIIAATRGTMY